MTRFIVAILAFSVGCFAAMQAATPTTGPAGGDKPVRFGNFSISLAVKDVAVSRDFYEKLGFRVVGGDRKRFVIMQNETSTIGLYQGMFERNMLTYNPGWDRNCTTLAEYDDVRTIQKELKRRGLKPDPAADESTTGPASFIVVDPDGNPILVDQHVPSPGK